jgi:DNA-directed RNA polymerase omega subunit
MKEGLVDSLEGIDSRFRHAILAAKRAKQLVGGAKKKVDIGTDNPLAIALEEIRMGKINFHILEEEEARELPKEEPETREEENEIDRDLFFRPNVSSKFDDEEEEEDEGDEDEDEDEDVDDEDEDDEDEDDEDSDDYGDDYDDDEDDEGIIYEGDDEDDD